MNIKMIFEPSYHLFVFYSDGKFFNEYFYSWNTCKNVKRNMMDDSDAVSFKIVPERFM